MMEVDNFLAQDWYSFYQIVMDCKAFLGDRMTGLDENDDQFVIENDMYDQNEDVRIAGTRPDTAPHSLDLWVFHVSDEEVGLGQYIDFELKKRQIVSLEEECLKTCGHDWLEISRRPELKQYLLDLPSHMINYITHYTPSSQLEDPECLKFILQTSCNSLKFSNYPIFSFQPDFTKLTDLDISDCKIAPEPYLQLVRNLPKIKTLSLKSTEAFDEILRVLGEHSPSLESLNLQDNSKITDKGIVDLCSVKDASNERQSRDSQIQNLEIVDTSATLWGCFFAMSHLPRLTNLNFPETFSIFSRFEENLRERDSDRPFLIRSLHANNWYIFNQSEITLANGLCPNITKLHVSPALIRSEFLPLLGNFENLTHLELHNLNRNEFDPDSVNPMFIEHFSSFLQIRGSTLKYLKLAKVPVDLNLIGRFCPNLIEFHLKHVCYKCDPSVVNNGKVFQNVVNLEIVANNQASDCQPTKEGLILLFRNCNQLNHLRLKQVDAMTPAVVSEILKHNVLRRLESAIFTICDNINGECLRMLLEALPSLKEIKISK